MGWNHQPVADSTFGEICVKSQVEKLREVTDDGRYIWWNEAAIWGKLKQKIHILGGGFKYFLCSPLFGEDSHLTTKLLFFKWVDTTTN